MKVLADLHGAVEETGLLAMIKFRQNAGIIRLHNFPRLEVSERDSSGNARVLVPSGLLWIGFHSLPAGPNPTHYVDDAFEAIDTCIGTRFMSLKKVFMESGSRSTFSAHDAAHAFVLGPSDEEIEQDIPELLFHLGVPKSDVPKILGRIVASFN